MNTITSSGGAATTAEPTDRGWEVDAPDGTVVYLGRDLSLAEEIYYRMPLGAHLHTCFPRTPTAA